MTTSPGPGRPSGIRSDARGLTQRQERILLAVARLTREQGYPPSMRELGAAVDLASPSSVAYQVQRLQQMGMLAKDERLPRSYTLTPLAHAALPEAPAPRTDTCEWGPELRVPLLGKIAAGSPITVVEVAQDHLTVPRQLVGTVEESELFALTVQGHSMAGPGRILDGDLVVVRRQQHAEQGDVIAAMIDGDATVKRLRWQNGRPWLTPDNPAYAAIPGDQAAVLGKVIAVMRGL